MNSSYIVAGCRTPIGKFLGSLTGVAAPQLGAVALAETLRRSGLAAEQIDQVVMGNVLAAGLGQAPARQAALQAGLPPSVAALTINKMCGSGLKAVMLADLAIRAGDAQAILAGGMENMSRAPYLLDGARSGWKAGNRTSTDSMIHDGLWCAIENKSMGAQADYIAHRHGVTRQAQDAFALLSHQRAVAAWDEKKFVAEVVGLDLPGRGKTTTRFEHDEGPRRESSAEALASLRPSFETYDDIPALATAGNASQISDGAAAVAVVSAALANSINTPLKARIVASATSGVEPKDIFIAPVTAVEQVLRKAELILADIDLFELNEAFAAQCLACTSQLDIPSEKLNVWGGAIALGHPIGASGARVLVTLLHALAERGLRRGLASLCLGGGNAVAMIVERL